MTKAIISAVPAADRRPRPRAAAVSYDRASNEIRLMLRHGVTLAISRDVVAELRDLPADSMRCLTLIGDGEALACEAADVHVFVPGLVRDLVGDFMLNCI
jgi:hypothetical protein